MGSTYAAGFAEAVQEGWISLDQAVHVHLTANHYPPVPPSFVSVAVKAVELANQGDWDAILVDGAPGTVSDAIEVWHLWAFVEPPEDL